MPSIRFSRDKRGYEYVYLVHTPVKRGRPGPQRLLYWYRTPPGVRVGRKPFDEDVRRLLEQQNPELTFDWETIIATPMPPPDMTEFWRERRRLEKAARQERRAEEAAEDTERQAAAVADTQIVLEPVDASAGDDDPPDEAASDATGPSQAAAEGAAASYIRRRRRGRRGPSPALPLSGSSDSGTGKS